MVTGWRMKEVEDIAYSGWIAGGDLKESEEEYL